MAETYRPKLWAVRPSCANCGYKFGGQNGRKRDLIYRRLLAYSANGVPLTELLCEECAGKAPAEQKASEYEAAG